jgi:hypothetical protein
MGRWEIMPSLVPEDFEVPGGIETPRFVLEPLGPQHNEADYAAWTSSMEHIRATPGFATGAWPKDMTLAENEGDLNGHARDFQARTGFTYTVLDPADRDVIGCLYIYPSKREGYDADVHSWVRADRADLDQPLYELVRSWLAQDWPFAAPDYAPR